MLLRRKKEKPRINMTSNVYKLGEHPRMTQFCFYWLPPLLLTAGILIMAGDFGSGSKLRIPIIILEYLLPSYSMKEIIELYLILRKVGHFLAYAALFCAYARAWRWHMGKSRLKAVFLALAICLLISAGDESRQALHPSRTGSPRDVVLDMSGALTAALAWFPFLRQEDQG
jgi:VanZ family protein